MEGKILAKDPKKGVRTNARIGFSDESAFSDKPTVRKTWAPKGKTPILKVPGGWITRSVISLITCSSKGARPRLYFKMLKGAVNAGIFIGFLKGVNRHMNGRKLILIIDNLRVHKSNAVKKYLKREKRWLTVEYLPPYAPPSSTHQSTSGRAESGKTSAMRRSPVLANLSGAFGEAESGQETTPSSSKGSSMHRHYSDEMC